MNYSLRIVNRSETTVECSSTDFERKTLSEEVVPRAVTQMEISGDEGAHQSHSELLKSELSKICEYHVSPSEGQLKAMSSIAISISCHPHSLGLHKHWLLLDVNGVGEGLFSLPLIVE